MRAWLALLLLLAVACVAAFTWQWLAADPGYLLIRYGDTSVETTLIFALVALLLVAALVRLAWRALRSPLAAWSRRRRRRGRERIAAGLVALAEGRHAHAQRELERAAHSGELQGPALLGAARAAHARGDDARADALLERAPPAAAIVLKARFELEQERPQAALALLQRARDESTLPPAGWHLLVDAALRCNDARADALLERAPPAAAIVLKARFELEQERPQAALALLQRARDESTLPPAGWHLLVDAALRCNDAPAALAALPELARAQTLPPAQLAALEARVLGAALAAAADRDRLNALWSRLSKAQRRVPDAVVAYARRAAELGQLLAAMSELEAVLRRDWSERVIVCYGDLGPAEAEARLRYAEGCIAAQPNSAGLALTLGRLCNVCKLWGKARGYLERGLEIEPSPALWETLGECHDGAGDLAAAARCWRNALLAARGDTTQALPSPSATAMSTRAVIREERSEHGVPRLPGKQGLGVRG